MLKRRLNHKTILPLFIGCLLAILSLAISSLNTFAASNNLTLTGLNLDSNSTTATRVSLYKIATGEARNITVLSDFANAGVSINQIENDYETALQTVITTIKNNNIAPVASNNFNSMGKITFQNLASGVYAIIQTNSSSDFENKPKTVSVTPFLIQLPRIEDSNVINDVTSYVKYTSTDNQQDDPTPPKPDDPDKPDNPDNPDIPDVQTTSLSVKFKWDDSNNRYARRPNSFRISLTKNSVPYQTVELSAKNDWSHSWNGLDAEQKWDITFDGNKYYYFKITKNNDHDYVVTAIIRDSAKNNPITFDNIVQWTAILALCIAGLFIAISLKKSMA